MSEKENSQSLTNIELVKEIQELRLELDHYSEQNKYLWKTFVDTSRRLQVTTSSIKAAVTSLLMYDIFWDGANQHEFLATINTSIDQVSELVKLVVLCSRLQAGELELKCEPHLLQEILSVLRIDISRKYPNLLGEMHLPEEGRLVKVDYEYFKLALEMLLSIYYSRLGGSHIHIEAEAISENWLVKLSGVDPEITGLIRSMVNCKSNRQNSNSLSTENILGLHIICEIMHFQNVTFEFTEKLDAIKLVIPIYGE
jgi:K+-sensing histidine kinase KdpD